MNLNKFKKLALKDKITSATIGFLLIFLFSLYFIIIPSLNDIWLIGQEVEKQRIELENRYIKGYSIKQLADNLEKIKPQINLLDQIFINKNRELEFITTLENEANKYNVAQKINLSAPQPTKNKDFDQSSLQLYSNGEFNNILKYLANLESLSYYINIKSVEFTPVTGANQPRSEKILPSGVKLLIDADTYWN